MSDTNYLGSFKAEEKLDTKEKNVLLEFTQEKDPAIAFVTSSAVTKPLSNPEILTGFVI